MSIADDVKSALGDPAPSALTPSQLATIYDEEHPDEVDTGEDGTSIAFTYSDGSVLSFSNDGLAVNNENVEPEDDAE